MGGQGSPPGRNPTNVTLNVLVGDAKTGEAHLQRRVRRVPLGRPGICKGIAAKFADPARAPERLGERFDEHLRRRAGRRRRWRQRFPRPSPWRTARSSKGTLVRQDDFLVVLTLPDGTRRSMARTNGVPQRRGQGPEGRARQRDREARARGHATNKMMHDITAYLVDDQVGSAAAMKKLVLDASPRTRSPVRPCCSRRIPRRSAPSNYAAERADAARSRRTRTGRGETIQTGQLPPDDRRPRSGPAS